jgi:hypothetical protein
LLEHAARITANSITTALRGPWRLDGFDARGNQCGSTSPFRLTAHQPGKPPHVFIEKFVWDVTDPDPTLRVPAFTWLLTEHRMLTVLAKFPLPQQAAWRTFLNSPSRKQPLPFFRDRNRHGTLLMRRTPDCPAEAAHVAVALARVTLVNEIDEPTYREAFPVDLWDSSQGVEVLGPKIATVQACR